MQDLFLCISLVAPIFIMVLLGYFLKRGKMLTDGFVDSASKLLFDVVFPVMLFKNIYETDFASTFDLRFVGFLVLGITAFMLLTFVVTPLLVRGRSRCGVVIHAGFRSNMLILGIPLITSMFGEAGLGPISVTVAYTIPLYNILAVVTFSIYNDAVDTQHINWGKLLLGIIKNPMIVGTLVAVPFALWHWELPGVLYTVVKNINQLSTPFGLILLGAQMQFSSIRKNLRPISVALVYKLVLQPLLLTAAAVFMGFNNYQIGAVFVSAGAASSVSSFVMSRAMTKEGELAGQIVFIGTAVSVVTTVVGLFLLSRFGVLQLAH